MLSIDWKALERLRERFLSERMGPSADYWESDELLAQYDATFAQRIAWKWRPVLSELKRKATLKIKPPAPLVDLGCGTGIAAREYLAEFGPGSVESVLLYDRSRNAAEYAAIRTKSVAGETPIRVEHSRAPEPVPGAVLLLSHVATELGAEWRHSVEDWIRVASLVLWVEPGTPKTSQLLIEVRETFRNELSVIAPCPHQSSCGLLAPDRKRDWCHHFAPPPDEIFHSAFWREFSERLRIDLRALPVSYLVLERAEHRPQPSSPRVLGRVRVEKGLVKAQVCSETGIADLRILNKKAPDLVERLKEGAFALEIPPDYLP